MNDKYTESRQATDRMIGTGNRLITAIENSADSQGKHQTSIRWLTIVIAISTVIYTGVTIWSTLLQNEAIKISQSNLVQDNCEKSSNMAKLK